MVTFWFSQKQWEVMVSTRIVEPSYIDGKQFTESSSDEKPHGLWDDYQLVYEAESWDDKKVVEFMNDGRAVDFIQDIRIFEREPIFDFRTIPKLFPTL